MNQGLTLAVGGICLVLAAWALVLVVRNRALGNALFFGLALGELAILAHVGTAVVALTGSERPQDMTTFVSYLILIPIVVPAATFWALVERTRWGSAVVAGAGLLVPALLVRLWQVWGAAGG